jgi:hypothetical protein
LLEYQIGTKSKSYALHTFCILSAHFIKNIYIYIMCVFSFVRQKMNDERNVIFDVCCVLLNETNFFFACRKEENKSKKKHTLVFFSFSFFFTREPLFEFFFSNIKRTPLKCSKFLTRGIYLLVHRKQTLSPL